MFMIWRHICPPTSKYPTFSMAQDHRSRPYKAGLYTVDHISTSSSSSSSSVVQSVMGRTATDTIAMKTDPPNYDAINSDIKELKVAAKKFANHAVQLVGTGFATSFLQYLAAFAGIYLLILDRTNWKTNMLTSLLVPYIFLTLPSFLFNLLRGEVGKWIAFVAVVLKLFFPKHYPDWLEMPSQLVLLLVVTPSLFSDHVRGGLIGTFVCLAIGCYLLQEHIRACGGFRNAFTKANGISNAIGIVLLFVYPVWALIFWFL